MPATPIDSSHTAGTTPAARSSRAAVWILVALLIVRVAAAVLLVPSVVADAQGYDASAVRWSQTGSFAYPLMNTSAWTRTAAGELIVTDAGRTALLSAARNAYTMPGYSAFLAAIYRLAGGSAAGQPAARVAQAVLSVLIAWLVYLISLRFGRRIATTALVFAAIYPPLTLANSYLLTEVLSALLLTLFAYVYLRWLDSRSWTLAALAGAVFSLSLLVRPVMAVWIVLAGIAVLIWRRDDRVHVLSQLGLMGLAAMLVLAPWWVRNFDVYGRFVPFSTGGSIGIVEGIRSDAADPLPFPWQVANPPAGLRDPEVANLASSVFANAPSTGNDLALDAYYGAALKSLSRQILAEHPAAVVETRIRSVAVSLAWPSAVSPLAFRSLPFLVSWILQLGLLVLFVLGAFVMPRRLGGWVLVTIPAYSVLIHAAMLPSQRYYFPMVPVALVVAAIAFDHFVTAPLRRRSNTTSEPITT